MSSTATNDCRRKGITRGVMVVSTAAAIAIAGCMVIYGAASALGAFPDNLVVPGPSGEGPMTAGLIASAAALATFAAAVAFNIITRVFNWSLRTFQIIAAGVLLISIPSPFGIDGVTDGTLVALLLMHVFVAAVSVGFLSSLADR